LRGFVLAIENGISQEDNWAWKMNNDPTKRLHDSKSFEERVFARFDAMDARFDTMETRFESRFDNVEGRLEKLESRSHDTKPIWERALKAIMELSLEMGEVKIKVGAIENKVDVIENRVGGIESKVDVIESKVQVLENEMGAMRNDCTSLRKDVLDLKHSLRNRLDMILAVQVDNRDYIRDCEERIATLETKLA
jgi:chromosome segregation ATPase